jgi:hypothetical protein
MSEQITIETVNPGGDEVVATWTCTCGRPHLVTTTFLQESLPDDINFDCSFCGAPGPGLAALRTAAGI